MCCSLVSCLLSDACVLLSFVSRVCSLVSFLTRVVTCILSDACVLLSLVSRVWSLVSCLTGVFSCLLSDACGLLSDACGLLSLECVLLSHACVLLSLVSRVWFRLFFSGITTGIEPSPRLTYPLAVLPTLPATRYIYTHIAGTEVENERAVLRIHKVQEDKWRMRNRGHGRVEPPPSLPPPSFFFGGGGRGGRGRGV